MSLVVLLITEFHNGDDFFVWTYDDLGLYSQSPKMVRPKTETGLSIKIEVASMFE